MKTLAAVVALASLTINFGLIDLIDGYTGFVDQARNQVLAPPSAAGSEGHAWAWATVAWAVVALVAAVRPQQRERPVAEPGLVPGT